MIFNPYIIVEKFNFLLPTLSILKLSGNWKLIVFMHFILLHDPPINKRYKYPFSISIMFERNYIIPNFCFRSKNF